MAIFIFVAVVGGLIIWALSHRPAPRKRSSAGAIIGGAILIAGVLAFIAWNEINAWFQSRMVKGDIGTLIKERMAAGDYGTYALRGEIHDAANALKHSKTWEGKKLDPDLERRFGNADRIVIRA